MGYKDYNNLELCVLGCLILNPKYMEETILEEKHFKKYKHIWIYLNSFYDRFKTFDLTLMCSFSKNRNKTLRLIMELMDYDFSYLKFKDYEARLIEMYNTSAIVEEKIERYYRLATDLYFRNISIDIFEELVDKISKGDA